MRRYAPMSPQFTFVIDEYASVSPRYESLDDAWSDVLSLLSATLAMMLHDLLDQGVLSVKNGQLIVEETDTVLRANSSR